MISSPLYITSIGNHLQQCFTRCISFPLLTEAKNSTENHHCRDNNDSGPILFSWSRKQYIKHKRYNNQSCQYPNKRIYKCLDESRKRIFLFLMLHLISTINRLPLFHLISRKPDSACLKIAKDRAEWLSCCQKNFFCIEGKLFLTLFLLPHCYFNFD